MMLAGHQTCSAELAFSTAATIIKMPLIALYIRTQTYRAATLIKLKQMLWVPNSIQLIGPLSTSPIPN